MGSMLPYIAAPWIRHGYGGVQKEGYTKAVVFPIGNKLFWMILPASFYQLKSH